MRKLVVGCVVFVLGFALKECRGQAVPSAGRAANLQVGAGGLYLLTDYAARATQGVAVWGDFDVSQNLGLEGAIHFGGLRAPNQIVERSYAVGPKISVRRARLNLFGTAAIGQGTISNQRYHTSSTYNLFSYGVGLDYAVGERVNLRVLQAEREHWIGFPPRGLSPFSAVVGVSYVLP